MFLGGCGAVCARVGFVGAQTAQTRKPPLSEKEKSVQFRIAVFKRTSVLIQSENPLGKTAGSLGVPFRRPLRESRRTRNKPPRLGNRQLVRPPQFQTDLQGDIRDARTLFAYPRAQRGGAAERKKHPVGVVRDASHTQGRIIR